MKRNLSLIQGRTRGPVGQVTNRAIYSSRTRTNVAKSESVDSKLLTTDRHTNCEDDHNDQFNVKECRLRIFCEIRQSFNHEYHHRHNNQYHNKY